MEKIYGVIDVTSGYANGKTKNPKYQDLHSSGHAETVHVKYDINKVNLSTLLKYYFKMKYIWKIFIIIYIFKLR